jgi:hypothetical protein
MGDLERWPRSFWHSALRFNLPWQQNTSCRLKAVHIRLAARSPDQLALASDFRRYDRPLHSLPWDKAPCGFNQGFISIKLGGSAGQYSIVMAGLGPATHDLSAAQNGSPVGLVWFQPGEKVEMPFDAVAARGSRR